MPPRSSPDEHVEKQEDKIPNPETYWGQYGIQILHALDLPLCIVHQSERHTSLSELENVIFTYLYENPNALRAKLYTGYIPIEIADQFMAYYQSQPATTFEEHRSNYNHPASCYSQGKRDFTLHRKKRR